MSIIHLLAGVSASALCGAGFVGAGGATGQSEAQPTENGAGFRYGTDGVIQTYTTTDPIVYSGSTKYIGSCPASAYDHKWDAVSGLGADFSILENTWTQCSVTALAITMAETDEGTYQEVVDFSLRRRSDSVVVSVNRITITLVVDPP